MLPQSLSYHGAMRRFVLLLTMIFAFASLAGAATAHAHRYISTPIVVLNHVDAQNKSIPVIVAVQRGQIDLGAGILMPCGSHPGIEVTLPPLPICRPAASAHSQPVAQVPHWSTTRLLRPPIDA